MAADSAEAGMAVTRLPARLEAAERARLTERRHSARLALAQHALATGTEDDLGLVLDMLGLLDRPPKPAGVCGGCGRTMSLQSTATRIGGRCQTCCRARTAPEVTPRRLELLREARERLLFAEGGRVRHIRTGRACTTRTEEAVGFGWLRYGAEVRDSVWRIDLTIEGERVLDRADGLIP